MRRLVFVRAGRPSDKTARGFRSGVSHAGSVFFPAPLLAATIFVVSPAVARVGENNSPVPMVLLGSKGQRPRATSPPSSPHTLAPVHPLAILPFFVCVPLPPPQPVCETSKVPDPDEGMPEGERRYQIYLKSPEGPIDVYVVSQVCVSRQFKGILGTISRYLCVILWYATVATKQSSRTGVWGCRRGVCWRRFADLSGGMLDSR